MIESAAWLRTHAAAYGYDPLHIGPASVDLCLHPSIRVLLSTHHMHADFLMMPDTTFTFHPGVFYLCSTRETLSIPITHAAVLHMRSSYARQGLGHKMAGYIDPGFTGQLTLELTTDLPVTVPYHAPLVQVVFLRLAEPTDTPYHGQYQGQHGPTEAFRANELSRRRG